jgi:hypothetical protein
VGSFHKDVGSFPGESAIDKGVFAFVSVDLSKCPPMGGAATSVDLDKSVSFVDLATGKLLGQVKLGYTSLCQFGQTQAGEAIMPTNDGTGDFIVVGMPSTGGAGDRQLMRVKPSTLTATAPITVNFDFIGVDPSGSKEMAYDPTHGWVWHAACAYAPKSGSPCNLGAVSATNGTITFGKMRMGTESNCHVVKLSFDPSTNTIRGSSTKSPTCAGAGHGTGRGCAFSMDAANPPAPVGPIGLNISCHWAQGVDPDACKTAQPTGKCDFSGALDNIGAACGGSTYILGTQNVPSSADAVTANGLVGLDDTGKMTQPWATLTLDGVTGDWMAPIAKSLECVA